MAISNFNCYYKDYKKYLKNFIKKNLNYKPLIKNVLKKNSGRNNKGFITAYHRGGGVKRLFRKVCFNYFNLLNLNLINWVVVRIEYDNNRSSNIALLKYNAFNFHLILKKRKRYWKKFLKKKARFFSYFFNSYYIYRLANEGLKKGDFINFFSKEIQYFPIENQFIRLEDTPTGSNLFNIEFTPFTKGKLIRAAGSKAKLLRKYNKYGVVALPSGEKKLLSLSCFATLGIPSNSLYKFKKDYKAGNSRWKGIRPSVRGVAMNPIDHPHGGGEGKSSGGRHSVSKWGMLTKGYVTKRKKKKKKKNMSRSKWKGVFICYSLYKKYLYLKKKKMNNFIQIYNRSSVILNEFVGGHFKVYNGLKFINLFITENKIGHKFGEFSFTRKLRKCIHLKSDKKKK